MHVFAKPSENAPGHLRRAMTEANDILDPILAEVDQALLSVDFAADGAWETQPSQALSRVESVRRRRWGANNERPARVAEVHR